MGHLAAAARLAGAFFSGAAKVGKNAFASLGAKGSRLSNIANVVNTAWGLQSILAEHSSAVVYSVTVQISGHKRARIGNLYLLAIALASRIVRRSNAVVPESFSAEIDYKNKTVSVSYSVIYGSLSGAGASTTDAFQTPPMYDRPASNGAAPVYRGYFSARNTYAKPSPTLPGVVGKTDLPDGDFYGWPGILSSSSTFGSFGVKNQPLLSEFRDNAIIAETPVDIQGNPWQNPTPWFDGTGRATDLTAVLTAALMPTITLSPKTPNTAPLYSIPLALPVAPNYTFPAGYTPINAVPINLSDLSGNTITNTTIPKEG